MFFLFFFLLIYFLECLFLVTFIIKIVFDYQHSECKMITLQILHRLFPLRRKIFSNFLLKLFLFCFPNRVSKNVPDTTNFVSNKCRKAKGYVILKVGNFNILIHFHTFNHFILSKDSVKKNNVQCFRIHSISYFWHKTFCQVKIFFNFCFG